jgi:hypothetical protein
MCMLRAPCSPPVRCLSGKVMIVCLPLCAHLHRNYNTVESVLLFCAVLVNLAGVMFESGRFDSGLYNSQRDFLTWTVVVIIVVSVGYFIVVLFSEIYTMLSASAKKRRVPKKGEKKDRSKQRAFADAADGSTDGGGERRCLQSSFLLSTGCRQADCSFRTASLLRAP